LLVEDRHDDFHGGAVVLLVGVDRYPAPVVGDGHRPVLVDAHLDGVAVPGQRLVDGVVHDLVDEMMEAASVRRADVHRRTLLDGF